MSSLCLDLCAKVGRDRFVWMLGDLPRLARKEIYKALKLKKVGRHRRAATASLRSLKQSEAIWDAVAVRGSGQVAEVVLRNWILFKRGRMVTSFLDQQGVTHKNGLCDDMGWLERIQLPALSEGVRLLLEHYGAFEVRLYLEYIESPHLQSIPELQQAFAAGQGPWDAEGQSTDAPAEEHVHGPDCDHDHDDDDEEDAA